jgi:hypothetical protein
VCVGGWVLSILISNRNQLNFDMTKIKICPLNLIKLLSMPNIFVQSDFGTTVDQQTVKHTFQVIIKCTIISNLLPPFLEQNTASEKV